MFLARRAFWALCIAIPFLFSGIAFADEYDDYVPEVTARVARISVVRGDAQIRHADSQDWERVVANLPIVEGDEIATAAGSRLEIQFNSRTYLRLAENSYLKVTTLKDEGIAVSLPTGTMSLRALDFNKDTTYFEIDAPSTTIAVQKAGMYRIDSGQSGDTAVRVAVTDSGEARIYSDNAGFTLRNGRSANIFIAGNQEGEWETADAARYADDFDSWSLERDAVIAKLLKDAYYDKYYDRDMYGAEDLSNNGEWVFTRKYGYVWKPYRTSTSNYADWSPYRYGHWRWIPPYGWTWINDEPWGWATYHHGRWFYDAGTWYWSPYGYYRPRHSWWSPALVVISILSGNVCWYPLPYSYGGYYNYNSGYYGGYQNNWGGHHNGGGNYGGGHNGGGHNGGGHNGGGNPTPTPVPIVPIVPTGNPSVPNDNTVRTIRNQTPPMQMIPAGGVVTVAVSDFGRDTKGIRTAPLTVANSVLSKVPQEKQLQGLPTYGDLNGKLGSEIRVPRPRIEVPAVQVKTGAADRKTDSGPLDADLRKSRIFGDRPPVKTAPGTGGVRTIPGEPTRGGDGTTRDTGAVTRPPKQDNGGVKQAPVYNEPVRQPPVKNDEPVKEEPVRPPTKRQEQPVRETPRYDPPPVRETPRYDPPPKYDPPPRNDPPPTRHDPPPKSDPPPTKSDPPKSDSKPDKPSESRGGGKNKDGR